MATAPPIQADQHLVSRDAYLSAGDFEQDSDFIDGTLEDRPLGEFEHSRIQLMLAHLLASHESAWKVYTVTECRLQISETRFRVPDLMLLSRDQPIARIVRTPPLLCIEILSPEDTWKRMRTRTADYLTLGVQHIWVFDPEAREAFTADAAGFHLAPGPVLGIPGSPIQVTLAEVFAALPPATV